LANQKDGVAKAPEALEDDEPELEEDDEYDILAAK
jgi:hypothetical protein